MPKLGQIPVSNQLTMTSVQKDYHEDLSYDPSISSEEVSFEKLTKLINRISNQTNSTTAGSLRSSHRKTNFLKVVIIGDSNVGKTTLIENFQYKKVNKVQRPTIGADFMKKIVTLSNGKQVPLQVWDTAGQERFQSLSNTFYRGTDCCVIVFDLNNYKSYERIATWRNNFVDSQGYDEFDDSLVPIIIVGNKSDIAVNCREISADQVLEEWIDTGLAHNYIETSAFTSENVDSCFNIVAEEARQYQINTQDNMNNKQDLHADIMQQLVSLQQVPIKTYSRQSNGGKTLAASNFHGTIQQSTSTGSDSDNIYSDESETPPGYSRNKKFKLNNKKHKKKIEEQPNSGMGCCYFV